MRSFKSRLMVAAWVIVVPGMTVSGCAGNVIQAGSVPIAPPGVNLPDPFPKYLIGPRDILSVSVFQEPDLTLEEVTVESSGTFQMPLLGTIQAAGKTSEDLSGEITRALGARYLVNPNVAVNVVTTNSQRITVEGAVDDPGVFALEGNTSLIGAIALANGMTRVANERQVAIFRTTGNQRSVAVFDIDAIREGRLADPRLEAGDIVVVGFSGLTQLWQDFLQAAPTLAIFTRF